MIYDVDKMYKRAYDDGFEDGLDAAVYAIDQMLGNPGASGAQVLALKHLRGVLVGTKEDMRNEQDSATPNTEGESA